MTVIKRNGSEVTFDITKIIAAITKANESVDESIRMTPMQIAAPWWKIILEVSTRVI